MQRPSGGRSMVPSEIEVASVLGGSGGNLAPFLMPL